MVPRLTLDEVDVVLFHHVLPIQGSVVAGRWVEGIVRVFGSSGAFGCSVCVGVPSSGTVRASPLV